MNRKIILIICLALTLTSLWACVGEVDESALTTTLEETTQANNELLHDFLREGANWRFWYRTGEGGRIESGYIILDNDGNEIFTVHNIFKEPRFTLLSDSLLRVDWSGGSNWLNTRFYDLNPSWPRASAVYSNLLAADHGLVVYLARSGHGQADMIWALVVHDIFEPRYNHISFQLDFGAYGPMGPFTAPIEFIDENTLFIAYVNSEGERVEERLVLR